MINTVDFYEKLIQNNIDSFVGVPDSLLSDFCACVTEKSEKQKNIITANEGNAVGIAAGYYIATGKYSVVYMQNSGQGNIVNPLLSIADEDVYKIPMLFVIGWRGEPGKHDEPQHKKQGKVTLELLETLGVEYLIADNTYCDQIEYCKRYMDENKKPIALIIKKGVFTEYKMNKAEHLFEIKREEALEEIINCIGESFVVSTTGKTSREIFEIREKNGQVHSRDFLTVGGMGHTASIALGMSLGTNQDVFCIDGDGSFLMHMGGLAVAAKNAKQNFKYILINNGAHESVGGQPTIGFDFDIASTIKSFGFENVYEATTKKEVGEYIVKMRKEKNSALVINVNQGSRSDLGRPTIAPEQNKLDMMEIFKKIEG